MWETAHKGNERPVLSQLVLGGEDEQKAGMWAGLTVTQKPEGGGATVGSAEKGVQGRQNSESRGRPELKSSKEAGEAEQRERGDTG